MEDFMSHGACWNWTWPLISLHVISDVIIALSYFSIPLSLIFLLKERKNIPFKWIFALFAMFICACGTTHIMGIVTIWKPYFWLEGWIKFICATISIITAISLYIMFPAIIKIKTSESTVKRLEKALKEKDEFIKRIIKVNSSITELDQKTSALKI